MSKRRTATQPPLFEPELEPDPEPEPTPCFCPACGAAADGRQVLYGIQVPVCAACKGGRYRDGAWRCPSHGEAAPIRARFTQAEAWPRRARSGRTTWFAKWEDERMMEVVR